MSPHLKTFKIRVIVSHIRHLFRTEPILHETTILKPFVKRG